MLSVFLIIFLYSLHPFLAFVLILIIKKSDHINTIRIQLSKFKMYHFQYTLKINILYCICFYNYIFALDSSRRATAVPLTFEKF